MNKYRKNVSGGQAVGCCLLVIVGFIAYLAVMGLVFQWLWNIVVPSVYGGPYLDYPQSLAIIGLLAIIGGFFRSTFSSKD